MVWDLLCQKIIKRYHKSQCCELISVHQCCHSRWRGFFLWECYESKCSSSECKRHKYLWTFLWRATERIQLQHLTQRCSIQTQGKQPPTNEIHCSTTSNDSFYDEREWWQILHNTSNKDNARVEWPSRLLLNIILPCGSRHIKERHRWHILHSTSNKYDNRGE